MDTHYNIVDRLNMAFEEKRLESFKIWPYKETDPCNPKNLAEAGFFWAGTKEEPDSAQCFVCNKVLDGWESTDDPWLEHKSHAPNCSFIEMYKKEEDLTVKQFINLWKIMVKNIGTQMIDEDVNKLIKEYDVVKQELLNTIVKKERESLF